MALAVPVVILVVVVAVPPPLGTVMLMLDWLASMVKVGAALTVGKLKAKPSEPKARKAKIPKPLKLRGNLRCLRRSRKMMARARVISPRLRLKISARLMPVSAREPPPMLVNAPFVTSPTRTVIVWVKVCVCMLLFSSLLLLPLMFKYITY